MKRLLVIGVLLLSAFIARSAAEAAKQTRPNFLIILADESYGSAWANACNTPWRLYKHYGHEGGIGTSCIAHWPAAMKTGGQGDKERGRLCDEPAHLIDLMATCVDLADATYPKELNGQPIFPMEGTSLRPLLPASPTLPVSLSPRLLFWEHEGNRAVRDGRWKLVAVAGQPWELYDLEVDRVELIDLAAREPALVKEMSEKWDAWAERTHVFPKPTDTRAPKL